MVLEHLPTIAPTTTPSDVGKYTMEHMGMGLLGSITHRSSIDNYQIDIIHG